MAVIGIDLGTTNSLAVYWKEDHPELIPNVFGEYLTPSVVSIDENGEVIVGRTAKERLITHPARTAAGFKRYMGTSRTFRLGSQEYKPEELSAMVLKQLKGDAGEYLGEEVEEAIISVPAYFNDNSRMAVKNAGILAGLKVERLLNEPSAAALAYSGGVECEESRSYMVFDLGGGTLDISIVEQFDNITEIIAVAGDNMLGGGDFDEAMADYFYEASGLGKENLTEYTKASILRIAEQCKQELSKENEVIMQAVVDDKTYSAAVNREQLVKISRNLFHRIKKVIKKVLTDSHYTFGQALYPDQGSNRVDMILMVGGSGKMPVVRQYLEYLTKQRLCTDMNPDHAVALGVGVAAGIKQRHGNVKDLVLCDICPFTLGIQVRGEGGRDLMSPIIERNGLLPSSKTEIYAAVDVNQQHVNIKILQGESRYADENLEIGSLNISLPQNNLRESFNVTFTYDLNGILNVGVSLHSTGMQYEKVVVNQELKMSKEEIKRKVEALKKLTLTDRRKEEFRELLARGNRLYAETSGELRETIGDCLRRFELILAEGDLIRTRKAFRQADEFLKMAEVGQMLLLPGELEDMLLADGGSDDILLADEELEE